MVAAMTSESWERIPHAVFTYEAPVQALLAVLKEHNDTSKEHITVNTAMLKLIAESIKAAPAMNGHIHYRRRLISGEITLLPHVDASVPVKFPGGFMMTVTLRNLEEKKMTEIGTDMADILRRATLTNMEEVMYDVSIHNTLQELAHLRIFKALGRLTGALIDRKRLRTLSAKGRKVYRQIPESERLVRKDLEPGSITVTNLGSLYREWNGKCTLLEIIPPQLCAIALNSIRDGVLPLTIAFDHRALDADDIFPFMRRMDELLSSPETLRSLI